jgi:uncharacterized protein with PIN domain
MEDIKVGDCVIITNFETNDEWSPHYKGEISVIDRIDYPFYYLENDNTTPFTKEQLRVISTKIKFNMIKCKKCDSANVKVDFSQVYTSIPAKYGYICQDCGDGGYVNCDEVNRFDFNDDGYQYHPRSNNEDLLKHIDTPKEKENDNAFGLKGWICPKCGRCYSPFTSMCSFCGGNNWGTITCSDGTGSNINL